jgi:ribose transport system substrate-binding protein
MKPPSFASLASGHRRNFATRNVIFLGLALISVPSFAASPKVGVLLKDRLAFWNFVERGALDAGKALNAEITIKAPPHSLNVGLQTQLLDVLARQQIDVLVIAPINPENVGPDVTALRAKGVKVVALDTPLPDGMANTFVGVDQSAMSDAAARVFLSFLKDGDEVAILKNNAVDRPVLEREKKVLDALRESHLRLTVHADVYANGEKDTEEGQAMFLLEKYPHTRAIYTSTSRATLAMIKILNQKQLAGKIVLAGFGTYLPPEAIQAIEAGALHEWVAQKPRDIGYKGVEAAVALAAGQSVPAVIYTDFVIVTKDNLHEAKVQALLQP